MVVLCKEQGRGQPVSSPGGWLLGLCEVLAEGVMPCGIWHRHPALPFEKKIFLKTHQFLYFADNWIVQV